MKEISCLWIRIHNIIKMAVLPKLIYRYNAFPIKILAASFLNNEKVIQKIENARDPVVKTFLGKKVGEITFPNFKP